ncbi:FeoB-associated Cys-rich membrane protein [Siphonobacter sp. BAB-5385]|uniref:FeoB-associated Cys-rich membrane protein n=1 Tax=Siphonobacter curvatus TaxID=2094562 RepID=A0A2S7IRM0_9BACT|nr:MULTISPECIES: FeoB-associated Cys-rich membrane protein [Siphonobacter]OZI09512.1 FeoB-associated Cys-rich membrane protein [Siphonobacter sp. BAB-5385]PQA60288.1 FeoB-associated Cys-rich membrane protein [Siphonobacter curvatus]
METLVIGMLFVGALAYLGNQFRKQFSLRKTGGCAKGCGSCGAIKFDESKLPPIQKVN